MTSRSPSNISRRDALKLLGAAAGASVLANLPSKWSTPQITAGILPAHAQTSVAYVGCPNLGQVVDAWTDQDVDIDLTLTTPAGFLVTPKPSGAGQGLTDPLTGAFHNATDATLANQHELITVPVGNLGDGIWTFTVRNLGQIPTDVMVQMSGACASGVTATPVGAGLSFTRLVVVSNCVGQCVGVT